MIYDYAIIGACQAGLTAVQTLRDKDPDASILLINGEDRLPYKRTHLTKKLAAGFSCNEFSLKEEGWYTEHSIELWNNTKVIKVEGDKHTLLCSDGRRAGWSKLLLATGGIPFQADFPGKEHIRHLRTAGETETLREDLLKSKSIVVLGQGVEGVEIAEQCRKLGLEVHITGRDRRLMQRWLDKRLSDKLLELFSSQGINSSFNRDIEKIIDRGEHFEILSSKGILKADLVLSSTGIRGNPFLAESLGIYGKKGIKCRPTLETSVPDIYAAGDAVEVNPGWPRGLWHWAEYQGRIAAINMSGGSLVIENVPTRLKCEPFSKFYFSMAVQSVSDGDVSNVYFDDERGYLRIFERQGKSVAVLMEGLNKPDSKRLEKGVYQGLSADKLASSIMES